MGWIRDIGRVPWGIAVKNQLSSITEKYCHHGYLGYTLLKKSGVPEELAIIAMTHIGSGLTKEEVVRINELFGKKTFPVRDWYAKTLEEQIIVIADKIPGWNNTILAAYQKLQDTARKSKSIYSEYSGDHGPLWNRFWDFKRKVDDVAGEDVLQLFDKRLLSSDPDAYRQLPKPAIIAKMDH